MARPSHFTKKVREKVIEALTVGATYKIAADYAGISYSTLRMWLREAENGNNKYKEFERDVRQASASAAIGWLDVLESASTVHWQAAAWKLERRFPNEYGKRDPEILKETDDAGFEVVVKGIKRGGEKD